MLSIALRRANRSVAPEDSSGATEGGEWREMGNDFSSSALPQTLRYVHRLLERAGRWGIHMESLYITDVGDTSHLPRVSLSRELLSSLAQHQADFSYGAFSCSPEKSRYAIKSFYVLRFNGKHKEYFQSVLTELESAGFLFCLCCAGETPYIIFPADENGLECFWHEAARVLGVSHRRLRFQLDYFTNYACCFVDLEPEMIESLVHLRASLKIVIHRNMKYSGRGKDAPFWRHVLRTARAKLRE